MITIDSYQYLDCMKAENTFIILPPITYHYWNLWRTKENVRAVYEL